MKYFFLLSIGIRGYHATSHFNFQEIYRGSKSFSRFQDSVLYYDRVFGICDTADFREFDIIQGNLKYRIFSAEILNICNEMYSVGRICFIFRSHSCLHNSMIWIVLAVMISIRLAGKVGIFGRNSGPQRMWRHTHSCSGAVQFEFPNPNDLIIIS